MSLTWRPLARADIPAWAELLAAAEAVDRIGENVDADDLDHEFDDTALDPARDTIAVLDGDRLVAFGMVSGATAVRERHHVQLWGTVHPRRRGGGIGRVLLGRQLERAVALHAERHPTVPGVLEMRPCDHMAGAVALARSAGLVAVRHWFDMECQLDATRRACAAPDGLRIGRYDPARDDAVRLAHNESFAAHYGSPLRDEEQWRHWFTGAPSFRPELSMLALDGPELAGYALAYFYPADAVADGYREVYLGQIGTRPGWRGRGAASALISAVLAAAAADGYQRAALGVDAANITGALRLYERLGFETVRSATSWAREIPASR